MDGVEEEGVAFERYTPCHPLPEEIRSMKRDDTVCQYCGVSYLIHNEIKAMEEKLRCVEAELEHYKGSEEREKLLKQRVNSLELLESELRQTLMAKDGIISTLQSDVKSGDKEKSDLCEKTRSLENRLTDSLRDKEIISSQLGRCRDRLPSLLAEVKTQKGLVGEIQALLQRGEKERKDGLQRVLSEVRSKDRQNRVIYEQKLFELEREKSGLEESQKSLSAIHGEKEAELEKSCDQLRHSLAKKSEDLEKCTSSLRMVTLELEQLKNHLRTKSQEIESLNSQLRSSAQSNDQTIQRLQTELSEKNGEVGVLGKRLKEAENRLLEQQGLEEEIRRRASVSITETQDLKDRYERAQGDLDALKAEREVMIEAHQNRIAELKESFKNKMYEAEKWPEKLEAALQKERSKHRAEMSALEGKLKESFVLEMEIEKQKHEELLQKYLTEFKDKERQLLASLEGRLESEVAELKRQLAEARKCAAETESKLREEISSLKAIIRDLEDRLARAGTGSEEVVLQLREQLQQANSDLHTAQAEVKVIQQQFDDKQKEVQFLQETVRRECEERFELTEALGEAREQLLAAHKPPGGYGNSHPTSKPVSRLDSTVSSRSTHSQSSFSKSPPSQSADSRPLTNQSAGSITSSQNGGSNRLSPKKIDSQISVGSSERGGKSMNSVTEVASSVNMEFKKNPAKPSGKLKGKTIAENRKRIAALLGKR